MSAGSSGGASRGRGLTGAGGLAVLAVLGLGACGGSSPNASTKAATSGTLNTPRVALAIQQSILSERHIRAQVVCPPNVPQKKGLTFTCVATTFTKKGHHAVHTMFSVFQTDSAGHVYYQSPK